MFYEGVTFPYSKAVLQITFDGKQAAHLMKVTGWFLLTLSVGSIYRAPD